LRRDGEEWRRFFTGSPTIDCFAVLGLSLSATLDQIKARNRELAKVHHPDRGGDAAEFNRINAAYEMACGVVGAGSR
jgi:DnaJ-domain-containing protein 1